MGTTTGTLTADGGGARSRSSRPGTAFVHPEHEHEFVNNSGAAVEFWVVYLVPAGATPLLNDVATPPRECS